MQVVNFGSIGNLCANDGNAGYLLLVVTAADASSTR